MDEKKIPGIPAKRPTSASPSKPAPSLAKPTPPGRTEPAAGARPQPKNQAKTASADSRAQAGQPQKPQSPSAGSPRQEMMPAGTPPGAASPAPQNLSPGSPTAAKAGTSPHSPLPASHESKAQPATGGAEGQRAGTADAGQGGDAEGAGKRKDLHDRAVDVLDSTVGTAADTAIAKGGYKSKLASVPGGKKLVGAVDRGVGAVIDKTVDTSDRIQNPAASRSKLANALNEDRKHVVKAGLKGAYEGFANRGLHGAAAGAIRHGATAALRTKTVKAVSKASTALVALNVTALAIALSLLMVMLLTVGQTMMGTWQYKLFDTARQGYEAAQEGASKAKSIGDEVVNRAQEAVAEAPSALEWTVQVSIDEAYGLVERVNTGSSDQSSDGDDGGDDASAGGSVSAAPAPRVYSPDGSVTASTVVQHEGSWWVNGQRIVSASEAGISPQISRPHQVLVFAPPPSSTTPDDDATDDGTEAPAPAPDEETASPDSDDDGAADDDPPEDTGSAADDDAGDVEIGDYEIDEQRAEELGLTEEEYSDSEYMLTFIVNHLAETIEKIKADRGVTGTLNKGVTYDDKGIGMVGDGDRPANDEIREIYVEALKSLPLADIDSKAETIIQLASEWWMGQYCTVPGSDGTGTLNTDGIPDEAIAWINAAAAASKTKIPPAFFAYIMDRETDFRPDVFAMDHNGGTWGLFQINEIIWKQYYGPFSTDKNNNGVWDIKEPLIHAEVGAEYFDDRLEHVRELRKSKPDAPFATELTELEALMIAHNAGEKNLLLYPALPPITRGYLAEFREKFESYGGGEPGGENSSETPSSGKLIKPQGEWPKTSDYGPRFHPVSKTRKFHAGTDYGMPSGTVLPAMFDGEVTFSGWMGGYGNYIIVKGQWEGKTLGYAYAHNSTLEARVGDKVKAGDRIATSGNTGVGTGPHLHLELRTSDFTGPGRESNSADPHAFLESNGAVIEGSPTEVDDSAGNNQACQSEGSTGGDEEVSFGECELGSKIEAGLTESGTRAYRAACNAFPAVKTIGGRRHDPGSDHHTGQAIDVMINPEGHNDSDLGQAVADFFEANHEELDVKYIIWNQQIWNPSINGQWRDMEDRGNDTANHFDHVHISVNN